MNTYFTLLFLTFCTSTLVCADGDTGPILPTRPYSCLQSPLEDPIVWGGTMTCTGAIGCCAADGMKKGPKQDKLYRWSTVNIAMGVGIVSLELAKISMYCFPQK